MSSKYNNLNGTGENKSSDDLTPKIIIEDHSPKILSKDISPKAADEQKSPKTSEIDEDILGEDTPEKEDTSSEFCDEDSPLKEEKSFAESSPDISSIGDFAQGMSKKMLPPKISFTDDPVTAHAEDKLVKASDEHQLDTQEKRKPRLNRRSFHQHHTFSADLDKSKSDDVKCDKEKVGGLKKNIISLSSVKNTTSGNIPIVKERKKIILKRKQSSSFELEEKNESSKTSDAPPKKKHKPITWP